MSDLKKCDHIIQEKLVNKIFKSFEHEKIKEIDVKQFFESENRKYVTVDFKDAESNYITYENKPLKISYINDCLLRKNTGRGKVIFLEQFFINEEFRKCAIASKLHKRELKFYTKLDFIQIQLDAVFEGTVVWIRAPFNFQIESACDERQIIQVWRSYILDIYADHPEKNNILTKVTKGINSIPKEYLLGNSDRISFSDWYIKKDKKLSINMYKNLAKEEINND
ncbi:hypothetical protein [Aliarcobacter butzleri]|uniref:hypothetical protein n=1 Tax=Aliarcobacter butzleri TaxID=28197 RepID=UPI001EDA18C3|nr:hypothetical protein [Aliarcobacter butzleri]MCG3665082.1 hypothetical protein [Aliarcobacter butzleri]MCT7638382.1 hypothetical protein [Aliarcobacter butzleri]